jgi:hypothetical protein
MMNILIVLILSVLSSSVMGNEQLAKVIKPNLDVLNKLKESKPIKIRKVRIRLRGQVSLEVPVLAGVEFRPEIDLHFIRIAKD